MMTVSLIGATRNAWSYLYDTVAEEHPVERIGVKASYYFSEGTPPGIWRGRGATALGLTEGKVAEEEHLSRLFGEGKHPLSEVQLGRKFSVPESLDDRVNRRVDGLDPDLTLEQLEAERDRIVDEELARTEKQSVAGFEFVFSPPKSVSAWWALADPKLKDDIRAAHKAAIEATIEKLETDIIRTRTGVDGVAQEHVRGITAALFDHWDSRDGDPQLHTHMLVSNRVQGADGKWRTIDSRWSLMPAVATAGAYYDGVLMDELSNRFGVEWSTQEVQEQPEKYHQWLVAGNRVDTPAARHQFSLDQGVGAGSVKWQLAAVPTDLTNEFSKRSQKLVAEKDRLVAQYVKKHGRQPSAATVIKMRQQATLSTRGRKRVQSLKQLTSSWRERAREHVGDSFLFADRVKRQGADRLNDLPLWTFRHDDIDDDATRDAAELVLHQLAITRSTWGRRNAETGALRAIAGWRLRSPADRDLAVSRITELVLSQAIALTPRNPLRTPTAFQTANGEDMFHPTTRDLFTTRQVWDAEERLLEAGRRHDGARVDQEIVDQLISAPTGEEQRILSDDQAHAVENIATSGRAVDVLVGPAGAGKTTSLEKLLEIWEAQHGAGTVRGLAPTARAAEVLAESLGITTENTAKWLHETARETTLRDGFDYQLRAGELLIVDEASIAGTIALDQLRAQAEIAGAKLLLVGDWAQLAAVDAGGAFGLLATDRDDVPELTNLHRFKADWEGEASKLLRLGRTSGLDPYVEHERLSWGFDETIVSAAVDAWKADEANIDDNGDNLVSLLIAPTNDMVERLNDIARQWRIEQGHVDQRTEATIAAGVASPGDRIVTRQNARTLRTDHDRWVKNNDEWVVVAVNEKTGDIVAAAGDEQVTLPASYCRDHVQLAYATTAHRSQGRTVSTAHAIVDASATRETFYVAMTRGKLSNRAYVIVDQDATLGDKASLGMVTGWRDVLERVVTTRGGDTAAHSTLDDEAERIGSIRQLAAEHQTLVAHQLERIYSPLLEHMGLLKPEQDSPYLGPLLANMRRVAAAGYEPETVINLLVQEKSLEGARDNLAVLHHRLAGFLEDVHELNSFDPEYAPMLDRFRIAPASMADRGSSLHLYRTLDALRTLGEDPEEALREVLLSVDRQKITDPIIYVSVRLRKLHGIEADHVEVDETRRAPMPSSLIAGLIEPATPFESPDFDEAIADRERAIQLRAELLVDRAVSNGEAWLSGLGEPDPADMEEWRRRAVTVACFRDLYSVDGDNPLGQEHAQAKNRERDRHLALQALSVVATPEYSSTGIAAQSDRVVNVTVTHSM